MSKRSKDATELVLGAEPRANLLPPEVGLRVKARGTRRLLVLLVVLSLVVVGAGYVGSSWLAADAQGRLEAAQQRTQDLLVEQMEYSDATAVVRLLETTLQTRELGTSTEVVWADLLDAVAARLPDEAFVYSFAALARAPWEPEMAVAGPLREPRVATLNFVIDSTAVLDATDLFRSLDGITGFADATPDSVIEDAGRYRTTYTLNVDLDALAERFAADGEETE